MENELDAPWGLYCGVSGIYLADRDNNQKLKEKFPGVYNVTADQIP